MVDVERFGGLSAYDTRATTLGAHRRVILTHFPTLAAKQSVGFSQTLAKATRALGELAATLARGNTRRDRAGVQAAIAKITRPRWVDRVLTTTLTGTTFEINTAARDALEAELFGKRLLVTDREDWTIAEVVAAYRPWWFIRVS